MSQEKIEIVRRIYERWGRGDFTAGVEHYDPYVLFVLNPEFPEAGVYIGPRIESIREREDALLAAGLLAPPGR
jgi:hypothetical protein